MRSWVPNDIALLQSLRPAPTTATKAADYNSRQTVTVQQLIAMLQQLPPKAKRLSVVYVGEDGWRHRIQAVRVVHGLKSSEIELLHEPPPR